MAAGGRDNCFSESGTEHMVTKANKSGVTVQLDSAAGANSASFDKFFFAACSASLQTSPALSHLNSLKGLCA
jgi:hypothetical protein